MRGFSIQPHPQRRRAHTWRRLLLAVASQWPLGPSWPAALAYLNGDSLRDIGLSGFCDFWPSLTGTWVPSLSTGSAPGLSGQGRPPAKRCESGCQDEGQELDAEKPSGRGHPAPGRARGAAAFAPGVPSRGHQRGGDQAAGTGAGVRVSAHAHAQGPSSPSLSSGRS